MKEADKQKRVYDLEERLITFAVRIMTVVEALPKTRAGNHVAAQLLRCGTSPAANYAEAQSAESRNDFIHKMKVALKELREARVWLQISQRKPLVQRPHRLQPLDSENNELIAFSSPASRQRPAKKKRDVTRTSPFDIQSSIFDISLI